MLPAPFQVEALRSSSLAGEETDKNQEKKITTHTFQGGASFLFWLWLLGSEAFQAWCNRINCCQYNWWVEFISCLNRLSV